MCAVGREYPSCHESTTQCPFHYEVIEPNALARIQSDMVFPFQDPEKVGPCRGGQLKAKRCGLQISLALQERDLGLNDGGMKDE